VRAISAPVLERPPAAADEISFLSRSAMAIGVVLYAAGTLSFIGIFAAFFELRIYAISSESRITFMILFTGLFCAFQGLIFILMARGGEIRRRQINYMLEQIRILYSHSSPGVPMPPGPE
jgi:hypothetical protein